jgi:hypothetical protein
VPLRSIVFLGWDFLTKTCTVPTYSVVNPDPDQLGPELFECKDSEPDHLILHRKLRKI